MLLRWVTGLAAASVMILTAWGGGYSFFWLGFILALLTVAAVEWAELAGASRPIVVSTILLGAVLTLLSHWGLLPLRLWEYLPVLLFLPTAAVIYYQDPGRGQDTVWAAAGIIWLSVPASLLYMIREQYEFVAIMVLMIGTIFQDSLALYTGYLFGGDRPFTPGLSPNKTWAGFTGGLLGMILVVAGGGFLMEWPLYVSLPTGLTLGLVGQAGDLSISALKRRMDVDDTGQFFPGHGGILDRCDALIFNAAVFYPVCRLVETYDLYLG
ncbi:MAG: phosphatidate cytidylyltransferase [bacterium]